MRRVESSELRVLEWLWENQICQIKVSQIINKSRFKTTILFIYLFNVNNM